MYTLVKHQGCKLILVWGHSRTTWTRGGGQKIFVFVHAQGIKNDELFKV